MNIYFPNETYYTYVVYAKPSLDQTYQMFVGYGLNKETVIASVKQFRVILNDQNYVFNPADSDPAFLSVDYDDKPQNMGGTGLVTIRVSLSLTAASKMHYEDEFSGDTKAFCQPRSYCAPDEGDDTKCVCAPDTACTDDSVCRWGINDIDCPLAGCFAFGITMPGTFSTGLAKPPVLGKFSQDPNYNWTIPFKTVGSDVAGKQCTYTAPPGVQ